MIPAMLAAAALTIGSPACTDDVVGSVPASCIRSAVVYLVNQERAARAEVPLRPNYHLHLVASRWNAHMIAIGALTHGSLSGFIARVEGAGYRYWRVLGENAGTGYATPREIVAAWMASPPHRANILDPRFRDVGTGVSAASIPGYAPGGTWTQDFGVRAR